MADWNCENAPHKMLDLHKLRKNVNVNEKNPKKSDIFLEPPWHFRILVIWNQMQKVDSEILYFQNFQLRFHWQKKDDRQYK